MEEVLSRHKQEKKAMQAKLTQLKHSAKNDKKRKKEILEEIEKLERDMHEKHEKELIGLTVESTVLEQNGVVENNTVPAEPNTSDAQTRVSKAEKRREKKMAQSKKLTEAAEQDEISARSGKRQLEIDLAHAQLRQMTVETMRGHKDDFLPFLVDPKTGDMLDDDNFDEYLNKMAKPNIWGGQPEIRALSLSLKRPIEIFQADASRMVVGQEFGSETPLRICYHHHFYRLGEHYNSCKPLEETESID